MGTACSAACCRCSRRQQTAGTAATEAAVDGRNYDLEEPVQSWERTVEPTIHWPQPSLSIASSLPQNVRPSSLRHNIDLVNASPTGEDCVICLGAIEEECAKTSCGHYFHKECIEKYLAINNKKQAFQDRFPFIAKCPICRTSLLIPLAVEATASSGRQIEIVEVPPVGSWLRDQGWKRNLSLQSTVSTGIPNGPYSGPVFSRMFPPGKIELMGSNTWEGVYFVFIEVLDMPAGVSGVDRVETAQDNVSTDVSPPVYAQGSPSPRDSTILGTPTESISFSFSSDDVEEGAETL